MASHWIWRWAALVVAVPVIGFVCFAQQPQPAANMVSGEVTLKYLNQTIDWYRHVNLEDQLATDASDAMFLKDDRQVSKQILRLSFDFARAQAQLIAK